MFSLKFTAVIGLSLFGSLAFAGYGSPNAGGYSGGQNGGGYQGGSNYNGSTNTGCGGSCAGGGTMGTGGVSMGGGGVNNPGSGGGMSGSTSKGPSSSGGGNGPSSNGGGMSSGSSGSASSSGNSGGSMGGSNPGGGQHGPNGPNGYSNNYTSSYQQSGLFNPMNLHPKVHVTHPRPAVATAVPATPKRVVIHVKNPVLPQLSGSIRPISVPAPRVTFATTTISRPSNCANLGMVTICVVNGMRIISRNPAAIP